MNALTISQFVFALGTILLIKAVVKDRSILKGYDLVGSFLTFIAMSLVLIFFVEIGDWLGLVSGGFQWVFWLFVTLFQFRNRRT